MISIGRCYEPRHAATFGFLKIEACVPTWLLMLVLYGGRASYTFSSESPRPPVSSWPGADLFSDSSVHRLEIVIRSEDSQTLRQEPRTFVRASVTNNGREFQDVALHLKGSVGSFQPFDDKPSFTLDFNRFRTTQTFHDLRRIHLNNSVEDPSFCNELLGSELFRQAGLPAPRVAHALVSLNGRRLGLYVLKEGTTEDFLSCYFKQINGNLFEPGEGHDVNQRLKRMSIQGQHQPRDELRRLAAACMEQAPSSRWETLGQVLDREKFITFMVLEVMLCHRDGYCLARNNFRVYQDTDSGRIVFFPQGMDQLFGSADLPWQPHMSGLVARAVIGTPQGAQQYRELFSCMFTNLFTTDALSARLTQVMAKLRPVLSDSEFAAVLTEAGLVRERIKQRQLNLALQLTKPELSPLEFKDGVAPLADWVKIDEPASGSMEQAASPEGTRALHIFARSDTLASWRTKALLTRGRYRFAGKVRVKAVEPLGYGVHQGAGLRLSGSRRKCADLVGNSSWQELETEFEIDSQAEQVELICELRASRGEAWFELDSLRVLRVP